MYAFLYATPATPAGSDPATGGGYPANQAPHYYPFYRRKNKKEHEKVLTRINDRDIMRLKRDTES